MKKFLAFFYLFLLLFLPGAILAQTPTSLNAYIFYGEDCPHCALELEYLENIKERYSDLKINKFEIYYHPDNSSLLQKVSKTLDIEVGGVPFLIIGDKYFVGYREGVTSLEIENRINECLENKCSDSVAKILNDGVEEKEEGETITTTKTTPEKQNQTDNGKKIINFPILGLVDIQKFSLPVLAVIMGILDGFNPCAMWTLILLISLLLGLEDKKKMWTLGVAFIVSSAFVYFIFMSAWLNLILFLGFIFWVRITIGVVALLGGSYSLKEFLSNRKGVCKVTSGEKQQKVFQRLKVIINESSFWVALGGIIVLAFMVNLIELVCSAGLPAVYTQVLALNELAKWQYYLYILLYIFFFMVDDILVFFVAMVTLKMTGVTTKYARYSRLIGGVMMLLIGLLLIFSPQLLMFG